MNSAMMRSMMRPLTRFIVGLIAIPLFRFILRRVIRLQELDSELEKDLEQWFRGSLLLLVATANMEHRLFGWLPFDLEGEHKWIGIGLRVLLAIGVVEAMPDQDLFSVIHPGPPRIKPNRGILRQIWQLRWAFAKGVFCQHLNRSSPVLAIMAAIFGSRVDAAYFVELQQNLDPNMLHPELVQDAIEKARERWMVGWVCYGLAISQYLFIGLVTSRDKALSVLSEFDRAIAKRRREIIDMKNEADVVAEDEANAEADDGAAQDSTDGTDVSGDGADNANGPRGPD